MDRIDIVCDVARPSDRVIQGELDSLQQVCVLFVISGRDFASWRNSE